MVVVFSDRPEVKKLIRFLITKEANEIAAKNGFISPNRNVPLENYPDSISRKSAKMLQEARIFVFDASDLMPPAVGNQGGFWDACKRFVQNPESLDEILMEMEEIASKNY